MADVLGTVGVTDGGPTDSILWLERCCATSSWACFLHMHGAMLSTLVLPSIILLSAH